MKRRSACAFGLHFDFHAAPASCPSPIGGTLHEEDIREICRLLHPDYLQIDCKGALENKTGDYLKWFGPWQCAKMGAVTVGREAEKYLDRLTGYRLFHGSCSVRDAAKKNRIPFRVITNSNDPAYVQHIRELQPDLIISYSAPQVIRDELLGVPKYGVINVHGALLPDYRGLLPSFWYLYKDEKLGGATVHYMSAKIDDGDRPWAAT